MKPAKRSSIRKAGGSLLKGTVRGQALASEPALPPVAPAASALPKPRYLTPRAVPSGSARKRVVRIRIPAILLEGDAEQTPSRLRPVPTARPTIEPTSEAARPVGPLPEAYGSQKLKLTPRDPHWVHARWDFTQPQLRAAAARSAEGRLTLRLFQQSTQGPLVSETHVPAESTRWMLHAPRPGLAYAAEIGYYDWGRQWSLLAAAEPVRTPPAGPSADVGFQTATLSPEGRLQHENEPGPSSSPARPPEAGVVMGLHPARLNGDGLSSVGGPALHEAGPTPSSPGVSSWVSAEAWSSPMGAAPRRPFRLEVNADLIVYGSTEPDATLQIGDRILPLEADGTFRLRFSLPDGTHPLTVKATAAGTGEQRVIQLCFVRRTETGGTGGRG